MKFPSDWPAACPPDDAEPAEGAVYRIVNSQPPEEADFVTHFESGKLPKAPACLRCGLSVFRDKRDAIHQRLLLPKLGKWIATAELIPQLGMTKRTSGTQPTHTTWWAYEGVNRAAAFSVVAEEE
jgi:hypothetical protein